MGMETKVITRFADLVSDLRDHFGTLAASTDWHMFPTSFFNACLAEIDTACSERDYDRIIQIALDEGMDLDKYC